MLCPNCSQQMNVRNVDNEIVLHCATCGSSFFDKGGINKITQKSAQILTDEAQGQYVLGNQKLCPKDKSILLEKVDATLPKNTILLECPSCEGIFAYPDDLLKYKGVKESTPLTSGAFKLLPAPKSLFMLASFAVLTVAVLLNTGSFSTNTRAGNSTVNKVFMNTASNATVLTISFTSTLSEPAKIILYGVDESGSRYVTKEQDIPPPAKTSADAKNSVYSVTVREFDKKRDVFYVIQFASTSTTPAEIQLN